MTKVYCVFDTYFVSFRLLEIFHDIEEAKNYVKEKKKSTLKIETWVAK